MTSVSDYWRMLKARGWRRVFYHFYDVTLFDAIYGTDTDTWLPLGNYRDEGLNLEQAIQYQPSFSSEVVKSLDFISSTLGARISDFDFFDLGSGKGKVCFLARHAGFRSVNGIEFYHPLVEIAQRNAERFRGQSIQFHCVDVTRFAFPSSPVVLYGYNPFGPEVWAKVLKTISDRAYIVIYNNPIHRELCAGHHIWHDDTASALENQRTLIFANFEMPSLGE